MPYLWTVDFSLHLINEIACWWKREKTKPPLSMVLEIAWNDSKIHITTKRVIERKYLQIWWVEVDLSQDKVWRLKQCTIELNLSIDRESMNLDVYQNSCAGNLQFARYKFIIKEKNMCDFFVWLETARGIAARAPMAHIFWLVPCIVGLFLINFGHS